MNRRLMPTLVGVALVVASCGGSTESAQPGTPAGVDIVEAPSNPTSEQTPDVVAAPEGADVETAPEPSADAAEPEGSDEAVGAANPVDAATGEVDEELVAANRAVIEGLVENFLACAPATPGTPTATARGVTDDSIEIAFLHADVTTIVALGVAAPLGPEADQFRAFMDDINRRCGGINGRRVEVTEYNFDPAIAAEQDEICELVTQQDENFLVVGRLFIREAPLCLTEQNDHLYFSLFRSPTTFFERSEGRLFSLDMELTRGIALQTLTLLEDDVIDADTRVGLVWSDAEDQDLVIDEWVAPILEGAGVEYVPVELPSAGIACAGYEEAVTTLVDAEVDVVLSPLTPLCYPQLVAAAADRGFAPRWVATDHGEMTSLVGGNAMVPYGEVFDGALGHSPTLRQLGPIAYGDELPLWEAACNFVNNRLLGSAWAEGSVEFAGVAELCSAAYAVTRALQAAGTDLTQEAFIEALEGVDEVPLRNDMVGGFSAERHFAAPDASHTVEWQIECGCWRPIDGPHASPVLDEAVTG